MRPLSSSTGPVTVVPSRSLTQAAWARRACAVEATPSADASPVHYDDIVDALRALDRRIVPFRPRPHYRHVLENRIPGVFGRYSRDDDRDQPLH